MLGCSDPEPIACDDAGWQRTKRSWGQGWAYPWLGVRMVVASPRAHPCLFLATFGWNLSWVTGLITSCSSFPFTGYIVSGYTQFPVSEDSLTQGWLLFVGVVWPHSHGFMVPESPWLHRLEHFANLLQCHVPRSRHVGNPVAWSGCW
jgi:hypothetical protein